MSFSLARIFAVLIGLAGGLYAQPVPFVNTPIVPEATAPGGHGFVLTVNGCGFVATSLVEWNGHPRATTFVSDTQLTAKIAAADIATAQTATVTVVTPGKPRRISNPVRFEVTTPESSIPMVSSLTGLTGVLATAADLNGDGIPDIIMIPGNTEASVYVALSTGPGDFGPEQTYPVSGIPVFVAVGDFNGDGYPDLAVATTSGIDILYNTGSGAFGAPRLISKTYFITLAVGDFNGDGRLDLVAGWLNPPDYSVQVILQLPGKGFAKAVPYPVVGPLAIAVGDFNRDNILDLAVVNTDDSISILLGNGDGTFGPQTNYPTGSSSDFPTALLTADFNGDGNLDLARTAALDTAGVGILLGNGDGTFEPAQIYFGSGYGIVTGDFTGDGKLDLAVGANGTNAGILLGNGNGTFEPVEYIYGFGFQGLTVAAGDFNQNGRLDLVLGNYSGAVELMLQ